MIMVNLGHHLFHVNPALDPALEMGKVGQKTLPGQVRVAAFDGLQNGPVICQLFSRIRLVDAGQLQFVIGQPEDLEQFEQGLIVQRM